MISDLVLTLVKIAAVGAVDFSSPSPKGQIIHNGPPPLENSEITADALHAYAKVEQELAIARRTLISETVEIEEYYGNSFKGDAGAKVSTTDLGIGIRAENGKVTKRVIKFSGFNAETESILNAMEASLLTKLKAELSPKQDGYIADQKIPPHNP
ncbi:MULTISPECIES: hypothetical protein [Klebsiella pneumoniae complex]|uniref:hypothetical protein n=1 Tax=Klebsiella pneumoniae complex TaxID=3390273 RepID=UPI001E29F1C7|nr:MULTISPECIES: hypothetical protein [Klebsiella]MDT9748338.1 hypothetical protein [Klebsiella variicola]MDT9762090.1 hypothetical protein [Klebsiella variicola]